MSASTAIALTKRDPKANWKTKEGEIVNMSDMTDGAIQDAIIVIQKRQIDVFNQLVFTKKLEDQLLLECKNRNLKTFSLGEQIKNSIGKEYTKKRELLKTVFTSIKRKLKKTQNVKEKAE